MSRKVQAMKKQYAEKRRAEILERNRFESFEIFIPKFNINIGQNDPTPYEAVRNIVLDEKRTGDSVQPRNKS